MTAMLNRVEVADDLSPLGGRDLAEVLSTLHDSDNPFRAELVELLYRRLAAYDRVSLLEWHTDALREVVRAAPLDLAMPLVSATANCDASCRVRGFWRHLVSGVLGEDLAFGVPPIH